jgi:hypothetical protein
MADPTGPDSNWLAVIGKSLAFICLSEADLRDKDLLPQATFLQGLGLSRADAAQMLGTTAHRIQKTKGRGFSTESLRSLRSWQSRVKTKRTR